jgi:VIT1/CCC1 family predicted Fe2+/Mn2+ transporter
MLLESGRMRINDGPMTEAADKHSDPLRHAEEARRRAGLALYAGEHHHLPGGGYLPEAAGELLRGALVAGCAAAACIALALPLPSVLAIVAIVALGHAVAEALLAARAASMQIQFYRTEIDREAREIREDPDGERRELLALYEAKGLRGKLLEEAVDRICSDPETLLKVMLEEELGMFAARFEHPALQALIDGLAAAAGALPLLLGLWLGGGTGSGGIPPVALAAWLLSAAAFGALRSRTSQERPLEAAAVSAATALAAGGLAYLAGRLVALAMGS